MTLNESTVEPICQRVRLIKLEFNGTAATSPTSGRPKTISREVKSSIGAQLTVDGFHAKLAITYELGINAAEQTSLAEITLEHELQYLRAFDFEPPTSEELRTIFIDGQETVHALVRERVLSLTAALGIRPVVLPSLPRREVASIVDSYSIEVEDSAGEGGSDGSAT